MGLFETARRPANPTRGNDEFQYEFRRELHTRSRDASGTGLRDVFREFNGRVQEATQEIDKEVQEVLVNIVIDKGLPQSPGEDNGSVTKE